MGRSTWWVRASNVRSHPFKRVGNSRHLSVKFGCWIGLGGSGVAIPLKFYHHECWQYMECWVRHLAICSRGRIRDWLHALVSYTCCNTWRLIHGTHVIIWQNFVKKIYTSRACSTLNYNCIIERLWFILGCLYPWLYDVTDTQKTIDELRLPALKPMIERVATSEPWLITRERPCNCMYHTKWPLSSTY